MKTFPGGPGIPLRPANPSLPGSPLAPGSPGGPGGPMYPRGPGGPSPCVTPTPLSAAVTWRVCTEKYT